MSLLKIAAIGFATLLCSLPGQALATDWQLNNEKSTLNFVSIKKETIGELHYFKDLSGNINDKGEAVVEIDLRSVETNIPIRNERMQKMLFDTAKISKATIVTATDLAKLKALAVGEQITQKVAANLTLVGVTKSIAAQVVVTKLTDKVFSVSTMAPILLNASDFGLVAGIGALQKIAGLPSIATSIPVTFNFYFEK